MAEQRYLSLQLQRAVPRVLQQREGRQEKLLTLKGTENSPESYLLAGGTARDAATPVNYKSSPVNGESLPPASQILSLVATQLQEKCELLLPTRALGTCEPLPPPRTLGLGTCCSTYVITLKGMINRNVRQKISSFQAKGTRQKYTKH